MSAANMGPATRRRPTTWIATLLLALALGMVAFVWLSLMLPGSERLPNHPATAEDALAIFVSMITFVSLPVVGTILAIRRPDNPIGWLLLVSGVSVISGTFNPEYVARSVLLGEDLPGYEIVDWLGYSFQNLGFVILATWVPLLFPDGHLPAARWRAVGWLTGFAMATAFLAGLLIDHPNLGRLLPNPITLGQPISAAVTLLLDASAPVLVGCIAFAFGSVVIRFRRSRDVEHAQLKWFLSAVVAVVGTSAVLTVTQASWAYFALVAAMAFVPAAIGIAVLRYRLYEIDRLISRTLGWAIVSVVLAGTFILLVVGLQTVLQPITGGNTLAVAGSTLVVAALFQGVRSRVQSAVDRRFDRSRIDGQRLIAQFSERLRNEVDPTSVDAAVLVAVDAAVRPSSSAIWRAGRPHANA